jgi:hypothetical protein
MIRTAFGFYEVDAAPNHGLPGELAGRLGRASETPGFIDGAVYVRADNLSLALQVQLDGAAASEDWADNGAVSVLLQAADWRSRAVDFDTYRYVRGVEGDGEAVRDSAFFIVQRFALAPANAPAFVDAICAYVDAYARPIPGFIAADAFASLDGSKVVFVMPWAHESALASLENRDGSLAAMQKHLRMSERHSFESYQRISYLQRTEASEAAAGRGES